MSHCTYTLKTVSVVAVALAMFVGCATYEEENVLLQEKLDLKAVEYGRLNSEKEELSAQINNLNETHQGDATRLEALTKQLDESRKMLAAVKGETLTSKGLMEKRLTAATAASAEAIKKAQTATAELAGFKQQVATLTATLQTLTAERDALQEKLDTLEVGSPE